MGWGSSINYHLSRLPQLWLNHKRKSVDGLSLAMFAIIFAANASYAASLLSMIPVSGPKFFYKSASYIYGPVGSIVIDVFVLIQFFSLRKAHTPSSGLAKKAKSRNILVRLISSAGTGYTYVKQRPRTAAYRLTMMKFDPRVNRHVLFTEHKMK
ncbi:hypothetical protein LPJ74_001185 [Coemansia sp. RSA 1843]|nr:hypothetical protein LPJ74_001185 [Coemansia sp. RSA 1843]